MHVLCVVRHLSLLLALFSDGIVDGGSQLGNGGLGVFGAEDGSASDEDVGAWRQHDLKVYKQHHDVPACAH